MEDIVQRLVSACCDKSRMAAKAFAKTPSRIFQNGQYGNSWKHLKNNKLTSIEDTLITVWVLS